MDNLPEAPSLREQSVRGGAWAAIGAAGASAVGLVNFLVLSRLLGPQAYGLMAMVEASLAFGQRLMSSGLSEPLIQIQQLDDDHSDTLFWTLQAAGLAMAGLTVALSGRIGVWFGEDGLPPLIAAASVVLYLQASALVPGALLARRFGFSETAQARVLSEVAGGAAAIAWGLTGHGVSSLVVQIVVAAAVSAVALFARARWLPRFRWSARAFDDLWRFSASRGLEGVLLFVDQQAPRIILGKVAGATELGYFVFARRVVENCVTLLSSPIRTTALSTFAAIQTDFDRVRRAYAEGIALTASAVLPASAGIALVAPYLVLVVAGLTWEPSVLLLQLLVLASVRQSFHVWNGAVLRGLGRPQMLLAASLLRSCAIVALIFALLPWRAPGVCVAIVVGSYLSWPVAIRFVRTVTGMSARDQLRPGRAPLLATLAMAAFLILLQQLLAGRLEPLAMLVVCIAAGIATYIAAMSVVGRAELASLARNLRVLRRRPKTSTAATPGSAGKSSSSK